MKTASWTFQALMMYIDKKGELPEPYKKQAPGRYAFYGEKKINENHNRD